MYNYVSFYGLINDFLVSIIRSFFLRECLGPYIFKYVLFVVTIVWLLCKPSGFMISPIKLSLVVNALILCYLHCYGASCFLFFIHPPSVLNFLWTFHDDWFILGSICISHSLLIFQVLRFMIKRSYKVIHFGHFGFLLPTYLISAP